MKKLLNCLFIICCLFILNVKADFCKYNINGKSFTADNVDGIKEVVEEAPAEEAPAKETSDEELPTISGSVEGVVATVKHGKVVISIKEGKDIYLELPI